MTTIEALQLASGDEVGKGYKGYLFGIVMRASDKSVSIFWEDQKAHETTTYSRGGSELRDIILKRKAPQKAAVTPKNSATTAGAAQRPATKYRSSFPS